MYNDFIEKNKDNIINNLCDLIKFDSVSLEDSNLPNAPFGEECKKALDYTLNLGKEMGFTVKNIDGYCGYIEFGKGEEIVGIIGHLDVVPASLEDGWTTPPFSPSIRDNKIFGRGAIDDKGPVIASLYAMKAVYENLPDVNKRVRLILGLNEEKSWKCINRYKETEEYPSIGFSPDANFPGIYAEKGILSLKLTNDFKIKDATILDINCNNNAINVVPKYCSITLKFDNELVKNNLKNISDPFMNSNITIENIDNSTIKIISIGKASHAAHPENGINAVTNLVKYLIDNFDIPDIATYNYLERLFELGFFDIESPEFLSRKDIAYATEFDDNSIIQDESGTLTSNVASMSYENEKLSISINLRVPVRTTLDEIILKYKKLINLYENIDVQVLNTQEPLFVSKDSYLVKTLVDIFNSESNLESTPIAIGGGTYARAFPNFISYGATMPGEKDMCHQVDEFIDIDSLMLSTKIYAKAITELLK